MQAGLHIHTTVVTLVKPDDISEADFRAIVGEEGYPEFGKPVRPHSLAWLCQFGLVVAWMAW
jgi:hypothetical protein